MRHFVDDDHLFREVDKTYLDSLRRGAHPDSPNGILYEIASAFLRHFSSAGGMEEEHGYERWTKEERARVRRELLAFVTSWSELPEWIGESAGRRVLRMIDAVVPKEEP